MAEDYIGGFSEAFVKLTPYSSTCKKETITIADTLYDYVKKGKAKIFEGEISDKDGLARVGAGATLDDMQILTMDYLVYGVTKDFIREHMDICGCSLQELYEICEENGCVLIQAHPFREYCQIQNPKYLHGVERNFNSGHDNHNEKLDAWLKEPGREHLIITRGSDCHEIPQVGLVDFVIDEDVKNSMELAQVLKKLV